MVRLERNREAKSRHPLSVVYPLLRHTAIWNFALDVAAKLRARAQAEGVERILAENEVARWELESPLRKQYRELLASMRDSLTERGVPLAYAIFPSHISIYEERPLLAWADDTAADAQLTTVNFRDALRASGVPTDDRYLLPHDGHPSRLGHAIAAAALVTALDEAFFLGEGCSGRFAGIGSRNEEPGKPAG